MILLAGERPPPKSIALATAGGRDIPNFQIGEISAFERNQFAELDRRFASNTVIRSEATPLYNCHGMTFACRRTGIFDSGALQRVLADDHYRLLTSSEVLPGDVLLYYDENGDFDHSAVVVAPPSESPLGIPRVFSKWGKYRELLHWANDCPYDFSTAKYFRVSHE